MSSYYTSAQLEARRRAQLKQELTDAIQKLKEQLQTEHSNNAHISSSSNIEVSVFVTDDSAGGYTKDFAVTGQCSKAKANRLRQIETNLIFLDCFSPLIRNLQG